MDDPQVQIGGDHTVTMTQALEQGPGFFQVPNRLAPLASVLVLDTQVVQRPGLSSRVRNTAEGGQSVEERLSRLGRPTLSGRPETEAHLDLAEFFVLVGATQQLLGPAEIALGPVVLPHLEHDVSATRIDLGEADLVEVTGKNPAGEIQMLQGKAVVGTAGVAIGNTVMKPSSCFGG
jgi:hypothetical protein